MGILTKLDVVNAMLSSLGEVGVNSLDDGHPLVTKGLTFLRIANAREQGRGWWFNSERITIAPTGEGEILIPADVIQLDPVAGSLDYAQRGNRLYNLAPGTASPTKFSAPVALDIIRLVDFEDLPTNAQLLVSYSAQLDFLNDMDGDAQKVQKVTRQALDALVTLKGDHIRSVDVNFLDNPSFLHTFGSIRGHSRGRLKIR